MLTTYSQILVNVPVPLVMYRKGHGLQIVWFELFKLFPASNTRYKGSEKEREREKIREIFLISQQ